MRETRAAALATLQPGGAPFASYVITAPAEDGSPLLLLSDLAVHSRNLARDSRASLLFVQEADAAPVSATAERLTLTGRLLKDENDQSRRLFLAHHPEAAGYADFADFDFYRFRADTGHLVAGFGRIVELAPAELLG